MRTFRKFVANQVSRCESLGSTPNYIFSEAAITAICDWLEEKSGEQPAATRQSDLQWIQDSAAGRKVKAVVDEIMQGEMAPTMPRVREVWEKLHAPVKRPNYDCQSCHGTGYEIVERGEYSGAKRCPNGCVVPADRFHAPDRRPSREEVARMADLVGGAVKKL